MTRWLVGICFLFSAELPTTGAVEIDYVRDIKPILKERCYACHGALKQNAKLRLDAGALMRKGGRHGPALAPGNANESRLIERVTEPAPTSRMPPEGQPLTDRQIALLKQWIDQGANVPADDRPEEDPRQHWAFRPPVRPALPPVQEWKWGRNPIDAFIAAERDKRGLTPQPPAEKAVLLRRVCLDLIGLPPTPEELHAFLRDPSTDAYEKVVDQLLASPQYGERWARHWMDVWRYSDWYGRRAVPDVLNSYPQIWRWRDWIVRSLNEDRGYDWMIKQMLAADEIAPDDDANLVATGFIVRNFYRWNYNSWMRDSIEHTGKAFLGLTFNCCQCHDHKYDPITQEEYFKFRAFFEPIELRHDRVPGQPDPGIYPKYDYGKSYAPMKSGMIRIFDEKLDAQTFMYRGGDERAKIEGKPPIPAGVPAAIGGDPFQVVPVSLPAKAWYPGLRPFVRQEETARRQMAVETGEAALAKARGVLASAEKSLAQAKATPKAADALTAAHQAHADAASALHIAEAQVIAARSDLAALQARIGADKVRYREEKGDYELLARLAGRLERQAKLDTAQATIAQLGQTLDLARRRAVKEAKAKNEVSKLEQQLTAARKEAAVARTALLEETTKYSPLGPVYPDKSTGRRSALARWIASRNNPLTARVAVNHLWSWHFGRPLVETTANFGRNGKRPTHPELLDWLAVELMDNGWRMKDVQRLLVTSQAYRMRSGIAGASPSNLASDPDNVYLWRFSPVRMEAEVVRDSILLVAGELDSTIGGQEIPQDQGLQVPRRSLYFAHHGETRMEFLNLFDAANPADCYRRSTSVMPQQALALTNSELAIQQGRLLASKIGRVLATEMKPEKRNEAFVVMAFERIINRTPTSQEMAACLAFLRRQDDLFREAKVRPVALEGTALGSTQPSVRAWENFVQALFSHGDFVTIR